VNKLMKKSVSESRLANFLWFELSKASISPSKNSISFRNVQVSKIQHNRMEPQSPASPAIPHKQFLLSIQQYCFNERIVRAFQREPGFAELLFRSYQIYFIYDFVQRNDNQKLSISQLSRHSGIVQRVSKQRWPTVSRNQKLAVVIWPLMKTQKRKS
jgi:hypothetical protein